MKGEGDMDSLLITAFQAEIWHEFQQVYQLWYYEKGDEWEIKWMRY